ncbi:bifunctional 3'-5' exonuclease/DNA polymerase [Lysinibacter sp. HNR]|uniref:bifunctional 3'-5' exonuclease/DNA polymerase n=1 Tax=Lysinibacter sp. HNR TaxID=3031408 RepID=UPI0024353F4C|nr:bifunctional 3'-5' exonuclease/DNA polymerase [Lysinibacter sp. HNR]WGD37842.1 bifunctional 3'-5' exonuclease/DNA polymerase [Lysinibacter sp. HNR]
MYILVSASPEDRGRVTLRQVSAEGRVFDSHTVDEGNFAATVELLNEDDVRWVWSDTSYWYPKLLRQSVEVLRCHDLRLCHVILKNSEWTRGASRFEAPNPLWEGIATPSAANTGANTLFDGEESFDGLALQGASSPIDFDESLLEFRRQLEVVAGSRYSERLALLLVAESAGALAAAEMLHYGIPWRADVHARLLSDILGPRPQRGERPAQMEQLVSRIRKALDNPSVNPDSQQDLLRSLKRAGLAVSSTSKWELRDIKHPVIEPLLRYKKLSRLYTANGWNWLDTWVRDGRFHAEYIVGGVVTGRWAAHGGGALQLPAVVRPAVVADPGWKLVVADAAQLEPRILSAISGDVAMADAGRGQDLYQALVDRGVVDTREHAKIAMLGALYGSTTGRSASLMPRLVAAFPRALRLVEDAAREGESGGIVTTWLGRSSPSPEGEWWVELIRNPESPAEPRREKARSKARAWGRFTRNFVCQGSAAEWALCWLAGLRTRLTQLGDSRARPYLAYFLHDEVVVHTPEEYAEEVVELVREAAAEAGRLLFGVFPVEFPVEAIIADSYSDAKK